MTEKKKFKVKPPQNPPAGAIDELSLQNAVRKKYSQNWPKIVVELMKRVQAVNTSWSNIMAKLMMDHKLSIAFKFGPEGLKIHLGNGQGGYNETTVPFEKVQEARQYIEVLVMDELLKFEEFK